MRIQLFTITAFTVFLFTACIEKPEADFTWEPQNPEAGETVRFINLSKGANRYSWNLGNFDVPTDENPTTVYDTPGEYIVDLVASKRLRSDEETKTIVVL